MRTDNELQSSRSLTVAAVAVFITSGTLRASETDDRIESSAKLVTDIYGVKSVIIT